MVKVKLSFWKFWKIRIGMGRQFIAAVPEGLSEDPELKQLMGKFKRTMDERDQEVRWVAANLWHVTAVFLGDLAASQQPDLKRIFENFKPSVAGDFVLSLKGIGAFPSPEEARVLWVGVQENQAFLDLQGELSAQLKQAGFALGEKEFRPHLTLGRFRNTINISDLVKLGGRKRFGDYPIRELILFESVLQGNILKYMPILRRPV
jgi:RNA 2',3'-cyclic 3'-phosphodiesterase